MGLREGSGNGHLTIHWWVMSEIDQNVSISASPCDSSPQEAGLDVRTRWRPGDALAPLEAQLVSSAATGDRFGPDDDSGPDQAHMPTWGEERTVRADVLRHLLVDPEWPVGAREFSLKAPASSATWTLNSPRYAVHCAWTRAT